MTSLAIIPARMGSQRLPKKNLRNLRGIPLITHAIRKAKKAGVFDEIWVNSEHPTFGEIAKAEGVQFHQRPDHLGGHHATSEEYILEFLEHHVCDYLFQVHSIAPLLTSKQTRGFVEAMIQSDKDVFLSAVLLKIECMLENIPVNFSFDSKTNSQELFPVQRITWSITGWRRDTFLKAALSGACATYSGKIGVYPIDRLAGLIIKTEEDLRLAEALLPLRASFET
jgi:CMP-N-acetylneuraminic acid synthetase